MFEMEIINDQMILWYSWENRITVHDLGKLVNIM